MRRVPSATLVSRPWYDLSRSTPRHDRRAALAGCAALGLGAALLWEGTRGWPGSRLAMAWALGRPEPQPSSAASPLVLDGTLFATAPFWSAMHGGLEAAYRAHAALDAALAAAVAYWQGREEKAPARQRLMAQRDEARRAAQRLAGYLGAIGEWQDSGRFPPELVAAALDALSAHDQDARNNVSNVVILLDDEVGTDVRGRLIGLHFSLRGHAVKRELGLMEAAAAILQPRSPERAFLAAAAATVELQLGLLRLLLRSADAAEGDLAEMVDQLDGLLSRPSLSQPLQAALGTKETLRRLAGELAAESRLDLTTSDIGALAESYAKTGRAALDAYNVGLHFHADLRMMSRHGELDAAAFLRRALRADRELNEALAERSAAARARFEWMMDLAGSRTV